MPFPYKTVLITGATAGIGRALTERMIADGIFVVAVGRRADRLDELVAKHGSEKVVAESFDVSDLESLPAWAEKITRTYPELSSIILNAGFQRAVDFTRPQTISLPLLSSEVNTNYLSVLHTASLFLPHLISLGKTSSSPTPASVVLVSSGLGIVPISRCANYCATKSAVHSLAWTLRSQLSAPSSPETQHIRVIEIIPPAVQTELHALQPDLVAAGQAKFGFPLDEFADETWSLLTAEENLPNEEVTIKLVRDRWEGIDAMKREAFEGFEAMFRKRAVDRKQGA
ncbi:Fc.00g046060.m01.CDS01 [Cosmosporella sp. VM-42]